MNFVRGSEWRKWDLHVHSPASILNNQFGSNWDLYTYDLFSKAIEKNIHVIGITDYFSIDGYKKVLEYLGNEQELNRIFVNELSIDSNFISKIKQIKLFPNIELRLDNITFVKEEAKDNKLEYHIIFSDELPVEDIEQNFIHKLYITSTTSIDGSDKHSLTKDNLTKLGEKYKREHKKFDGQQDYYIGCMQAAISFDCLEKVLDDVRHLFNNKFVLVCPEDDITNISWDSSAHGIRKRIYSRSHLMFSSNNKTIEWGLKKETLDEFTSYKGCIWGSDAHESDKLFEPDMQRYCWIKGDKTFKGLLQAFNYPHDRIFVGNKPPVLERIEQNRHKYIKNIRIENRSGADEWFESSTLELNHSMVAIIGNKGSGKSALSDIISLLSCADNIKDASFLNNNKFYKNKKAKDYHASITYFDDEQNEFISLHGGKESAQRAKYLPQQYIERLSDRTNDEFQKEVDKLIFSYIPEHDRYGSVDLDELKSQKAKSIKIEIDEQLKYLLETVDNLISLENMRSNSSKNKIKEALKNKEDELAKHIANKPVEVKKPNIENTEIEKINKELLEIKDSIDNENKAIAKCRQKIQELEQFKAEVDVLNRDIDGINAKMLVLVDKNIIEKLEFRGFHIQIKQIDKALTMLKNEEKINLTNFQNNTTNKTTIESKIKDLLDKSNVDLKLYEKYKELLTQWEKEKNRLNDGETDSIAYYKNQLNYINNDLIKEYEETFKEYKETISTIYDLKSKQLNNYAGIYKNIEEVILEKLENEFNVAFDASFVFGNGNHPKYLLKHFDKGRTSKFFGKDSAYEEMDFLVNKIEQSNFSKESVLNFISDIYNYSDDFDKKGLIVKDRKYLYNYLGKLDYIDIDFKIKYDSRELSQLSPGERGMVLLLFYLILDKDDYPLIIDQPEDNLDNRSVFEILVKCILKAKKERQIIIVTHNPNIAVACDAEQIVYCEMDKERLKISYKSGSIEEPSITNYIVSVLEGTMPAFDLRKNTYTTLTKEYLNHSTALDNNAQEVTNDGSDENKLKDVDKKPKTIPIFYLKPAAGSPNNIYCEIEQVEKDQITTSVSEASSVFEICGDSMEPYYKSGDMIYLKTVDFDTIPTGKLGIFQCFKDGIEYGYVFKKYLEVYEGGAYVKKLVSLNTDYPDIIQSSKLTFKPVGQVIRKAVLDEDHLSENKGNIYK